jgi:hypothetical protein
MRLNRNGQYVLEMVFSGWCGGCLGLKGAGKENEGEGDKEGEQEGLKRGAGVGRGSRGR